jgi:hypothetical protein
VLHKLEAVFGVEDALQVGTATVTVLVAFTVTFLVHKVHTGTVIDTEKHAIRKGARRLWGDLSVHTIAGCAARVITLLEATGQRLQSARCTAGVANLCLAHYCGRTAPRLHMDTTWQGQGRLPCKKRHGVVHGRRICPCHVGSV